MWPSIGHYTTTISPIAEVEEFPATIIRSIPEVATTTLHGCNIVPGSVSPCETRDGLVWTTGVDNFFTEVENSLRLKSQSTPLQRINSSPKQTDQIRRTLVGSRKETRNGGSH